jgi:3-oxoacyl-[acyl-carrier-protein] synthase III
MASKPVAAIVGMGDAYASVRDRKDPLQLAAEATHKALADAGIGKDQVDAVFTGRSPWADKRSQWSNIFISHMQMPVSLTTEVTMHGAGLNATVGMAAQMIAAGQAEYVLCLQSDATCHGRRGGCRSAVRGGLWADDSLALRPGRLSLLP